MTTKTVLAAIIAIAAPLSAKPASPSPAPSPATEKVIEGNTPDRVAQVERCQGQKFESMVEIDPVRKRSTRIKLCANPGSSDSAWVKTLEAAIVQIEQRNMPPAARQKLITELQSEIARYGAAPKPVATAPGAILFDTGRGSAATLAGPSERYETSVLPPLPERKLVAGGSINSGSSPQQRPMRVVLKCFERGQAGRGGSCNFLEASTIVSIRAVEGLDDGATVRFLRRGDVRGEVALASMQAGQSARVKLPAELCRGVSSTKVEIELLRPKSTGAVATRLGPFGLNCQS